MAQGARFNNQISVACHNCYDVRRAVDFQDVFSYTKAIELDIWNADFGIGLIASLMGQNLNGDWYVKHKPQEKGNRNFVGGTFRDCLEQIKAWSDSNPQHDVVTIYIDKKQNWSSFNKTQTPENLDKLLVSVFGHDAIFTPGQLMGDKTNLKEAALTNWPSLDALKGKFVFVLTDGTLLNGRKPLNEYLDDRGHDAQCFVSPRVKSEDDIRLPKGFSKENADNVVFYNLKYNKSKLSESINAMECISRVYGASRHESEDMYHRMVQDKVNFIAFFNYKLRSEKNIDASLSARKRKSKSNRKGKRTIAS
jgi:hypothetical protein